NDPAKLNAEVEKANLQKVDTCSLDWESDTLKLSFTLKVLSGVEIPSVCNISDFQDSLKVAARKYIDDITFNELSYRYALNLASGRFLWRNRVGAENIEVIIKIDDEEFTFNSVEIPLNDFNYKNDEIQKIAELISQTLSGKKDYLLLDVTAFCQMGKGQEVYPSEELVLDKGKGTKSKILYSVDDIAGMHSQKIGNAIRTIDTWYPTEDEIIRPIAIEPYGAVTTLGKAFRTPKDKADFYSIFDKWACGDDSFTEEQQHYVMAILVRGGVFGESSKE
ncbi:MAG: type I-F CRISPR-associated protein Csy3, partial [Spirochaetales bacterium]|nr:type I-F CRISPR-associated protein Csy3 [Spirochaetales bacterium]